VQLRENSLSADRQAKNSVVKLVFNEQPQQQATSNKQPATSNQQQATSNN
jgi:hypothetical protein